MFTPTLRAIVTSAVVLLVAFGGFAIPVAATDHCVDGCLKDPGKEPPEIVTPDPGENFPDSTFDEHFPESTFDEHFPDQRAGIPVPNITR